MAYPAPSTVGVRELRQNLSIYLDRVKRGEALTVTEHGTAVAVLRPLPPSTGTLERLVAEGRASAPRQAAGRIRPLDRRLRKPLTAWLTEDRADAR